MPQGSRSRHSGLLGQDCQKRPPESGVPLPPRNTPALQEEYSPTVCYQRHSQYARLYCRDLGKTKCAEISFILNMASKR